MLCNIQTTYRKVQYGCEPPIVYHIVALRPSYCRCGMAETLKFVAIHLILAFSVLASCGLMRFRRYKQRCCCTTRSSYHHTSTQTPLTVIAQNTDQLVLHHSSSSPDWPPLDSRSFIQSCHSEIFTVTFTLRPHHRVLDSISPTPTEVDSFHVLQHARKQLIHQLRNQPESSCRQHLVTSSHVFRDL